METITIELTREECKIVMDALSDAARRLPWGLGDSPERERFDDVRILNLRFEEYFERGFEPAEQWVRVGL